MNYKIVQRQSKKARGWKSWAIVFDDQQLKNEHKHVHYATRNEAREKAKEITKAKLNNRHVPKENNKTVSAVVKMWQETVINSELSRDNIKRRVNFGDLMSDYPIGKLIVNDVKAKDIVAFYRSVKEKRNLTRKTILSYHSHMKNFFFWAIQNDFASATPIHESMVTTIFPKNDSKVFDVACISEENILKVQGALPSDTFSQTMFLTAIKTGMRLGEQLALTWADIDFENKSISINKNISEGEGTKADKLKGRTSNLGRNIPMNVELTVALQKWKMESKYSQDSDFVFTRQGKGYATYEGMQGTYNTARLLMENAVKKSGAIYLSWHDLRHYVASKLIVTNGYGEEDLKKISQFLGHEEIATTQRVYAHLIALQGHQDEKTQEMVASL